MIIKLCKNKIDATYIYAVLCW